jgi:putative colanic acid biosynthesis acetyltransferase WcaF
MDETGGEAMQTSGVRLRHYDNSWYQPGRSKLWQLAWFLLGLPVLRSALIPSSALRVWLLRLFGAHIGDGVTIKPGVRVKYPWLLRVGNDSWIGEDCWIDNLAEVRIGNDVCLSQGAYLCTGNHDWSDPAFGLVIQPILIEDGAWVGAKVLLAPGVVVGRSAVAAGGSVVIKSIPAFHVHAGNPAMFVRSRVFGKAKTDRRKPTEQGRVTI